MPREGLVTKEKLIRAAEHLLARQGVDGALTRDIVARAGQSNDSAIHYHFGTRQGLLAAILDKHVQRMEDIRRPALAKLGDEPRLSTLVRAIVEPVADELKSDDGRDFLRIIVQLAGQARVSSSDAEPLRGTALSAQLKLLDRQCRAKLPRALADERVAVMISMLTASLADRARQLEGKRKPRLGHEPFVANLVSMLTAALRAPA